MLPGQELPAEILIWFRAFYLPSRRTCLPVNMSDAMNGHRLVNMYNYVYTYIYIYIYMCVSVYVCVYIHIYIYVGVYVCVCVRKLTKKRLNNQGLYYYVLQSNKTTAEPRCGTKSGQPSTVRVLSWPGGKASKLLTGLRLQG